MRKSKNKKATKTDGDWMSKFKIFDKKEKLQQQQQLGPFQDELDEEEGEEELIEHVNLQNSVSTHK